MSTNLSETKRNQILDQAEIVLKERGFNKIERRREVDIEFGTGWAMLYIVAHNASGERVEVYPNRRGSFDIID